MAFYVVVEGHGEVRAVPNLLNRLSADLGFAAHWSHPLKINVLREADAQKAASLLRSRPGAEGLLVLRDDEDGCPRDDGPEIARWLQRLALPFPAACVLFYREFETLFLPCLDLFAGRPLMTGRIEREGIREGTVPVEDPEARRDAKRLLTESMPSGRAYKETTDQLALTRMLDFDRLRSVDLPCFGTLERALQFLLGGRAGPGQVFPLDR
jgi:hypothetical protein